MRLFMKTVLPVASLVLGLVTVNKLHPIPQIQTASAANLTIGTQAGPGGDHLVDGQGKSLYVFDKDPPLGSVCTDDCSRLWPPLTGAAGDTVGVSGSAQSNLLGTPYVRLDGSRQIVYANHALYYYQGDTQPGDTKGNNLNSFGGQWCLVSPSGSPLCPSSGSTPTAGSTSTPVVIITPGAGPTTGPTTTPPTQPGTGDGNGNGTGNPPACTPCTCTQPGQVNCLDTCGNSFAC